MIGKLTDQSISSTLINEKNDYGTVEFMRSVTRQGRIDILVEPPSIYIMVLWGHLILVLYQ